MWGFEMITDFQGKKDKRSNSKHLELFETQQQIGWEIFEYISFFLFLFLLD